MLEISHLALPVKLMAARSGEDVTVSPKSGPWVGTQLMTPSGMPASLK